MRVRGVERIEQRRPLLFIKRERDVSFWIFGVVLLLTNATNTDRRASDLRHSDEASVLHGISVRAQTGLTAPRPTLVTEQS